MREHRTRNDEMPGLVLAHHPVTAEVLPILHTATTEHT